MGKIAFQGEAGANSHIACQDCYPDMDVMACATFEQTFGALREGAAALAMIPVENTVAGRVADIHRLLPGSGLYITGATGGGHSLWSFRATGHRASNAAGAHGTALAGDKKRYS